MDHKHILLILKSQTNLMINNGLNTFFLETIQRAGFKSAGYTLPDVVAGSMYGEIPLLMNLELAINLSLKPPRGHNDKSEFRIRWQALYR